MTQATWLALVPCLAAVLVSGPAVAAAPTLPVVAVPDFYASVTLTPGPGVYPEQAAADQMAEQLQRAGGGRITVLPRATMRQAEGSLRWRTEDVLRYDRLTALAHAVGATDVVVGQIRTYTVGPEAGNSYGGTVGISVQVFDIAQGQVRLAGVMSDGTSQTTVYSVAVQQAIAAAIRTTVEPLLAAITTPSQH